MSTYEQVWTRLRDIWHDAARDVSVWMSRLSPEEKLLGLILFALVIMVLVLRRQRVGEREGSRGFQFVFALGIVVILSFGATWIAMPGR